jgi:hypothetical protein
VNSVRRVAITTLPGARIQIRSTSTQVLIAVAGFVLTFGASGSGGLPADVVYSATLSVILGLLYNFVFGGGIDEERHNGEPHTVKVSSLHEEIIEILLNLQVLALVFALVRLWTV